MTLQSPRISVPAVAARALPAIVEIIQANQPLPPAHFSTITVTTVVEETVGEPGLDCWAVGMGPNGVEVTAIGGQTPPTAGEVWRVVIGEGGIAYLDDLIR